MRHSLVLARILSIEHKAYVRPAAEAASQVFVDPPMQSRCNPPHQVKRLARKRALEVARCHLFTRTFLSGI